MSKLVLNNAGFLDAVELIANLRDEDARELDKTSVYKNRLHDVLKCMRSSMECKALRSADGELLALGGVIPDGTRADVWLLTTKAMEKNWVAFAKLSKKLLPEILAPFSALYNYVDVEYIRSIRWLLWLGFKTHEVYEMMPSRAHFVKVSYSKG